MFKKYFIDIYTKNYANFSGRARRQEYFMFQLFYSVALLILFILTTALHIAAVEYLAFALMIATIIPSIALTIRRLHDSNRSGFWLLAAIVPILNIVLLVFLFLDSSPGTNQYGKNPKGIEGFKFADDSNTTSKS